MQLQWQPVGLPANETEETLAAKVVCLQQLASQGPVAAQKEVHKTDADMIPTDGHSYQLPEYSTDLHKKSFLIRSLYSFVK